MTIRRAVATALARLTPCASGAPGKTRRAPYTPCVPCDRAPSGRRAGNQDPKKTTAVGKEKQ
ncbi:hypothetical protein [Streptomyces hesseae]|uniref:Uncharacterized protein n=1 Tax=Streptomyces hesseae TaxID=3075519 RepID=A0ABU2SLC0_9ACTN|nr:hypothetical protein [Streptomyces sp. DSM 40473]MDT0449773.1 hypothetical protein [Streptomyces sp. DSM 40473]